MTVTDVVAILGLVAGVTGTVLGILNYLRDRARVEVGLQWDMEVYGQTKYDPSKKWGLITSQMLADAPFMSATSRCGCRPAALVFPTL
jgi:hypothetical protein